MALSTKQPLYDHPDGSPVALVLVELVAELDEAVVEVAELAVGGAVLDEAVLDGAVLCEVDETVPNWYTLSLFDPPQYSVVFPLQALSHPEAAGWPPTVL